MKTPQGIIGRFCRIFLTCSSFLLLSVSSVNAVTPHAGSQWVNRLGLNGFMDFAPQQEVDQKVQAIYAQLFGPYNESGGEERSILRNHSGGIDAQYIYAVDSNDIRSEGMSYGMMIAVMMNDQATFDRLWRFVVREMWRTSDGQIIGDVFDQRGGSVTPHWVGWSHTPSTSYPPNAAQGGSNPAPDGEVYMAMALFFAHNRWGSSNSNSGLENWTRNYYARANDLLSVIRNLLWNSGANQIVFSPVVSFSYTDPSYHLPAFYELFGEWAANSNDRSFWKAAADTSRQLLKNSAHPTTGLATTYTNFDGSPVPRNTNNQWFADAFAYDSWRVIHNLAMDYYWWSLDKDFFSIIQRQWAFYASQTGCGGSYCNIYTWSGGVPDNAPSGARGRSAGHIAMNAVAALAYWAPPALPFLSELWNMETPTGTYRYYDGLLYTMAYLHLSGKFRIYHPNILHSDWYDRDNPSGVADNERLKMQKNLFKIPCRGNPTALITASDGSNEYVVNYPNHMDYFNAVNGLSCSNNGQQCLNYEVSYHCGNASGPQSWTSYYNASTPNTSGEQEISSAHNLPSSCTHRYGIRARVVGTTTTYQGPRDHLEVFNVEEGLRCVNADQPAGRKCQDYRIRLSCQ